MPLSRSTTPTPLLLVPPADEDGSHAGTPHINASAASAAASSSSSASSPAVSPTVLRLESYARPQQQHQLTYDGRSRGATPTRSYIVNDDHSSRANRSYTTSSGTRDSSRERSPSRSTNASLPDLRNAHEQQQQHRRPRGGSSSVASDGPDTNGYPSEEAELEALSNRLQIELKIKDGAENLLQVFRSDSRAARRDATHQPDSGTTSGSTTPSTMTAASSVAYSATGSLSNSHAASNRSGLQSQVEAELHAANEEIDRLERRIMELQASINGNVLETAPEEPLSDDDTRMAAASAMEALRSLGQDDPQSTSSGTSLAQQDRQIEILNGLVQSVQRNERLRWDIPTQAVVEHLLPRLADTESQNLRAAVYRTLRYLCTDAKDVRALLGNGLELFLIKTFSRNASFELEKCEALLLVRSWLAMDHHPAILSVAVVRAVVSLSENSDERLRYIAIETLAELVLFDVGLLTRSEGLRVVLQAFIEGPFELSPYLAMAFLPIMDLPETREMLRPGLDIELVISSFTTASGKSASHAYDEKLRTCARIVGMYLQTWTGLIYLSMNGKQAIKSFVSGLNSPHVAVREAILHTMFDVFRIDASDYASTSRRNTVSRKTGDSVKLRARSDSASRARAQSEDPYNRLNLVEHYLGLLLVILVDAGIFDVLMAARERDKEYSRKASILVGELLGLSMRVLPVKYGTQWQTLPRLFALVSHFDDAGDRLVATSVLSTIDRYQRQHARPPKGLTALYSSRLRSNSLDDPLARGQRQIENSKIRQGMQIDDIAWKNLLLETQVLASKEHQKWNFEAVLEAVEGPLLNTSRLNEVIKGTKFLKRLMAFFHPFERRYADLSNSPSHLKWTKLGSALLTTLLSNPEGIAYLQQDKLLRQIAEALGQLDPNHSSHLVEPVFAERRFAATMASGYFTMLGTLSKYPEGLKLMAKAKIFTLLYNLTDLKGREDIVTAAIESLHYEIDGHARIVLSKALNSSFKHVRLFATKHLTRLLKETTGAKDWLIRLLVTQLYDTSTEVRELTVSMLHEVCQSSDVLEAVVELRPALDHLDAAGAPLLFRFLSSPVGVRYLHEIEFIEQEMDRWFHELNDVYVVQLEVSLARATKVGPKDFDDSLPSYDGTVPLHFYGELVKTPEGRMILAAKGHFEEFAIYIRRHGMEAEDQETIAKLKSTLWAVGHVGATSGGVTFLEDEGIIVDIAHIAGHSKALSVRGTCYYVLGLISSSIEGAELLEASGWTAAYTPIGLPTGYCLPEDVDAFIKLPPWTSHRLSSPPQADLGLPSSHTEREIITAIANLSNNLLTGAASKTLAKIKHKHPELFRSVPLYARALHLLNTCHYRSTVRTYIIELFHVPLTTQTVQELKAAADRARSQVRRTVSQAADDRKSVVQAYKLNVDSDTDDDDGTSSEEDGVVTKEVFEPVMVVRGFPGLV